MTPKTLENYLNQGADPNSISKIYGLPALFLVITKRDQLEEIELLLKYGADPNIINEKDISYMGFYKGDTPLHVIIRIAKYPIENVKLLIDFGADPTLKNDDGEDVYDVLQKGYGKNGTKRNDLEKMTKKAHNTLIDDIYIKIDELLNIGYGTNIKG